MSQGKLADAQHALAQEYGFATWAKLKSYVVTLGLPPAEALTAAIRESDAQRVRELLEGHPELRANIDEPLPNYGFDIHALFAAVQRSDRATIDVLLRAGADIRKRTRWWAGGFGVLDDCDPGLVDFLVERGAVIDAHAAARLGMLAKLSDLVASDPAVVHTRGGGGQTPLHFAATVEIAAFLFDHGAEIDALDVDHESTPAQFMLRVEQKRHYRQDRQDVARYLKSRGCRTDLLMAAALGDADLVSHHLDADPGCIRMSVSEEWFPKKAPRAAGTIYIRELGANRTAHAVARDFGHEKIFELLMKRTPEDLKMALACELGDERTFQKYLARNPDAAQRLSDAEPKVARGGTEQQHPGGPADAGSRLASRYSGRDGGYGAALGRFQREC